MVIIKAAIHESGSEYPEDKVLWLLQLATAGAMIFQIQAEVGRASHQLFQISGDDLTEEGVPLRLFARRSEEGSCAAEQLRHQRDAHEIVVRIHEGTFDAVRIQHI